MLKPNLPSIEDKEGGTIPEDFHGVIDAHVHIFPPDIFASIWRWFDQHAWHIRYQLPASKVFSFLLSHGISHIIALQYAHKPRIAKKLNRYMAKKCQEFPHQITGMATVFPGENDAEGILREAFDSGLGGMKLHSHVQCFDMDSDDMAQVFQFCESKKKPIVMHVGREPKSPAYPCDPYDLCRADKLERVLINFPNLKVCVPHLGFDEISAYRNLIEKYDNLWLDTTMVLTDYFPISGTIDLNRYRLDRIMYGSDFPNIPYAWDRELKWLDASGLTGDNLEWVLGKSSSQFFDLNFEKTGGQGEPLIYTNFH
jgi:predicted TIM-barrel fold metal-dependent hydrolase